MTTESPTLVDLPTSDTLTQTYDASRKLWADALRSGKYRQGAGSLRQKDTTYPGGPDLFCCLGVACEVYQEHVEPLDAKSPEGFETLWHYDERTGVCPRRVCDWLNISGTGIMTDQRTLAGINDSGCGFDAIANLIETAEFYREPDSYFG